MDEPLPLTLLVSIDEVLRQAAASVLLCDEPRSVVVRHDVDPGTGALHRRVYDVGGIVEDRVVSLDHPCLTCALREDIVPTLARLARTGRWARLVLALPVAAEPSPVLEVLGTAVVGGRPLASVVASGTVVSVVDLSTVVDDLFGDDLLAERGLALAAADRRAVGEALARQLEHADTVACRADVAVEPSSSSSSSAAELVWHLAPDTASLTDLYSTQGLAVPNRGRVWTAVLESWRPLHPARLQDRLAALATGRFRGRGRFWLPGRPGAICAWDGVGGQLSIGTVGRWSEDPVTRLTFTGIDDDLTRLRAVFGDVLMTDSELARGLAAWSGRDDGFSPWLGEVDQAA
jgi:G3E family GTPase